MSRPLSDPIVGQVVVTLQFTASRHSDRGRPGKRRSYLLPLRMDYAGSEYLLQQLPQEMDALTNQVLKKVRAWEWRARQEADKQSQIIHPPGHQP